MNKTIKLIVLLLTTLCLSLFGAIACSPNDSGDGGASSPQTFTGITFENKTVEYDGNEHTITATGAPSDASVVYTNAGPFVEPGEYNVSVLISKEGYNDYTKTVTLKISKKNFTGITFNNLTVDYDGSEHTIAVAGAPSDASVTYTNAGPFINAGEYSIGVSITKHGYNDYEKTVKLKINKISYPSSIIFESQKFIATGSEKGIYVTGDLPQGTEIIYANNTATEGGQYNATATLKNPNYIDKTLSATLTIIDVLDVAKGAVNTLLERPDPWEYMPQAFTAENIAVDSNPTLDFTNFTSVSSINKNYMGSNMRVLWEGVNGMDAILSKIDVVYAIGETIASIYQTFINDNPDDYAEWTGVVAGFKIKILLNGNQSTMLVGNNVISLELFADKDAGVNTGRVDVAGAGVLNYVMMEDYLKFSMSVTIKGVMALKQIEFAKEDDAVAGYFYEYLGAESLAKKTSAVISFNEDYAIVMGSSLLTKGIEEVYNAKTGAYLGSKEIMKDSSENHWINVFDVSGITSVKAIENGSSTYNSNDVYVNGLSTKFTPKYNKLFMVSTTRRFDIEMRSVYYLQQITDGNNVSYDMVEVQVPMMFVQNGVVETFGNEAKEANSTAFSTKPTIPTLTINVANNCFETLKTLLTTVQENLTYQELQNQIGTKNEFFNE